MGTTRSRELIRVEDLCDGEGSAPSVRSNACSVPNLHVQTHERSRVGAVRRGVCTQKRAVAMIATSRIVEAHRTQVKCVMEEGEGRLKLNTKMGSPLGV
jgi:hypothetical protein